MTLNSPQLLSKRYMPWRILRAPGAWAQAYMDRAKDMRGYKSALVFPEQLWALGEAAVFQVSYQTDNSNNNPRRQTSEATVSIKRLTGCKVFVLDGRSKARVPASVEEIYEFEDKNDSVTDLGLICIKLGTHGAEQQFMHYRLFSAKRDVLAYAKKMLSRISD